MLQSVIYINIRETQSHTYTNTTYKCVRSVFLSPQTFVHTSSHAVFNLGETGFHCSRTITPHPSPIPPTHHCASWLCAVSILFSRSLPSRAVKCTENKLKTTRGHDIFLPYIVTVLRKRKKRRHLKKVSWRKKWQKRWKRLERKSERKRNVFPLSIKRTAGLTHDSCVLCMFPSLFCIPEVESGFVDPAILRSAAAWCTWLAFEAITSVARLFSVEVLSALKKFLVQVTSKRKQFIRLKIEMILLGFPKTESPG